MVTIHIKAAPSESAAKTVANSIAKSSLVKTAIFGQDANWGRVLAAVGYLCFITSIIMDALTEKKYSGVDVIPEKISLWFAKGNGEQDTGKPSAEVIPLLRNGTPLPFDEGQAKELLKNDGNSYCCCYSFLIRFYVLTELAIIVDLGLGSASTTMWTCDLTFDYIKINASYRS